MKIVVFGANGRTGREVVKQALAKGYEVTAFIRQDNGLLPKRPNLQLCIGDARNPGQVSTAITGQDAVISIIAPKPGDKKNYDISEIAARNIVAGMKAHNVRRLIIQSGAWGTENLEDGHPIGRIIFHPILKPIYEYKIIEDAIVKQSGLDYTIVRCALLTPFNLNKKPRIDMERHRTRLFEVPLISRKSVAYFILRILDDKQYYQKCPIITNK